MTKEHKEYIRQWQFKANEDINVIEYLSKEDISIFTSAICFHAQQAVEKFLKAFLVFHSIDFKKTHDLDHLLSECKRINPEAFSCIDLKNLSEFGVNVRYPDDFIIPPVSETIYFKELASRVKETVERLIS
jgi:HEPN domain-containing protein